MRPMPGLVDCINREWRDYVGPSTTISRPLQRNGLLYISKVLSTKTRPTCVTQVGSGVDSQSGILGRSRRQPKSQIKSRIANHESRMNLLRPVPRYRLWQREHDDRVAMSRALQFRRG